MCPYRHARCDDRLPERDQTVYDVGGSADRAAHTHRLVLPKRAISEGMTAWTAALQGPLLRCLIRFGNQVSSEMSPRTQAT